MSNRVKIVLFASGALISTITSLAMWVTVHSVDGSAKLAPLFLQIVAAGLALVFAVLLTRLDW